MSKEEIAPIDYKAAALAAARTTEVVAGNTPDERLDDVIKRMTDEEAQRYFEALGSAIEAVAGNLKK